jgi:hypothetical protein
MAKPSGYVTPSEFGYGGASPADSALYVILPIPYIFMRYVEDPTVGGVFPGGNFKTFQMYMDWNTSSWAQDDIEIIFNGPTSGDSYATVSNSTSPGWGNGDMPITIPQEGEIGGESLAEFGDYYNYTPRYTYCKIAWLGSSMLTRGLYFEPTGMKAQTDNPTVDRIDRTTVANKAYKAKRPASAWQVINLIASLNRLTYENYYTVTVPLFGETLVIPP